MSLGSITLYGVEMKPAAVSLNDKPQQFFYDAELKVCYRKKCLTLSQTSPCFYESAVQDF